MAQDSDDFLFVFNIVACVSLGLQRRFRGVLVGSGFIKGRTAYRGYLSAFAFFLPTFAPLCLRASSPLALLRRLLHTSTT